MDELDLPATTSSIPFPLKKVGTTSRQLPVKIREQSTNRIIDHLCSIELYTSLPAKRRGLHLSRLSEILQEVSLQEFISLQQLVVYVSKEVVKRQEVETSIVIARMPWVRTVVTPVSGLKTNKVYFIGAEAEASLAKVNVKLGIVVPVILACPCVQVNMEKKLLTLIPEMGIEISDYDKFISHIPMISHNQRGQVEVWLEDYKGELDPQEVVQSVEDVASISYDLLKRTDEVEVVFAAHKQPKFCEDLTRDVAKKLYNNFATKLPFDTKVSILVNSQESIHSYDIVSELEAKLGELDVSLWD